MVLIHRVDQETGGIRPRLPVHSYTSMEATDTTQHAGPGFRAVCKMGSALHNTLRLEKARRLWNSKRSLVYKQILRLLSRWLAHPNSSVSLPSTTSLYPLIFPISQPPTRGRRIDSLMMIWTWFQIRTGYSARAASRRGLVWPRL